MPDTLDRRTVFFSAGSVFFLSLFVLSYQIGLMKGLSTVNYSHFANLIISLALLGFGTSGTFLVLFPLRKRLNPRTVVPVFFVLLIVSIPLAYYAAVNLDLDIQYLFYSYRQILLFLLHVFLLFLPFFFTAVLIAVSFSLYTEKIPLLYGANLFGSGLGGILVLGVMTFVAPVYLPFRLLSMVFPAVILWVMGNPPQKRWPAAAGLIAALIFVTAWSIVTPGIRSDPYKDISFIRRLERQGDARLVYSDTGPAGTVELYESPSFHHTFFASPGTRHVPPEQLMIMKNGNAAGFVFRTDRIDEAAVMADTPQSIPYRLLSEMGEVEGGPSAAGLGDVLILGETGGANLWLALMYGARSVTLVQESPDLVEIWREVLPGLGTEIFLREKVRIVAENPRLFLKRSGRSFDIIHLAGTEAMPAVQPGLYTSSENYLLTVEGIGECLRLLNPSGCITITRGMQTPPKDNIKILSLFEAAHRNRAAARAGEAPAAGRHVLQSKNYLAVNTLLFRNSVSKAFLGEYLEILDSLGMDAEWYPGIESSAVRQRHVVPGPEGSSYSYYHQAAREILTGNAEGFIRSWRFAVDAPTDDRPYFHNFFLWRSARSIIDAYGSRWFRSSELGYLLLVFTFAGIGIAAFVFILLPLLIRRSRERRGDTKGRGGMYLFFGCIGIGFMLVEMVNIHKLGVFLGNPVVSVAAVITSILVFSGIGSTLQGMIPLVPGRRIGIAGAAVTVLFGVSLVSFNPLVNILAGTGLAVRFTASVLFIAPYSFFMGWFFASGIEILHRAGDDAGVPLAWGINGFASVAAAPLATLLSMEIGFTLVLVCAAGLYIAAASIGFLTGTGGPVNERPARLSL